LGGTFDPIHRGHLHIIEAVAARFDSIMVLPAGNPYMKVPPVAGGYDRVEMCVRALEDLPEYLQEKVVLTDLEVRREGPTYTIDTLTQLKPFFPQDSFTLILGSDAAATFDSWHKVAELKKLVDVLVVKRPGSAKSVYPEIEIDALDISATQIRELLEAGKDASPYISDSVLEYIKERGLYGSK
jgi:nicotinate-nucleotide adenylyltransferase